MTDPTGIPIDEVVWVSSSGADDFGRLFEWRGDFYRHIRPEVSEGRRAVLSSPSVGRALTKGLLIPTEVVALSLTQGDLVLRHERVPVVSYPSEWSSSMLKDAAHLILDLEDVLAGDSLTIADANPWNVLFIGPRPVFVDIGAIVRIDEPRLWMISGADPLFPARQQFERFFLEPLRVLAEGHDRLVRALLSDYWGISRSEREALTGSLTFVSKRAAKQARASVLPAATRFARRVLPEGARDRLRSRVPNVEVEVRPTYGVPASLPGPADRRAAVAKVRADVDRVEVTSRSFWANYYTAFHAGEVPDLEPGPGWTAKNHAVNDVLAKVSPRICLDIGSNEGWFSRLAERHGAYVIAADIDNATINNLHGMAKQESLRLLPLVFDVRSPTPGAGPCNRWLIPGLERLRADLVLALAVTHHLVFSQVMTFDQIAQSFAALSERWLLVEFMPRDDQYVADLLGPQHDWYTEEGYLAAFGRSFILRDQFASFPEPRKLFLFERREEPAN